MDWRLAASAFTAVFVAELGDKTQIATFALASSSTGGRLAVFLGSALALVCTSLIAVVAGGVAGRLVPAVWLERAGGVLMLALGAWMLWKAR
jgi:Ca2+/H+ antiporter, TMEM165/GDT1 family